MATTPPPQTVITTDDVFFASPSPRGAYTPPEVRQETLDAHLGRLAARALQCPQVEQTAKVIAAGLVELFGSGRLAVGVVQPGGRSCKLCALSSVPQIDERSERSQALVAALDEVVVRGAATAFGASDRPDAPARPLPLKAHERLARATGSRTIVGAPLSSREVPAAVLLWFDEGRPLDAMTVQNVLVRSGELLGPVLETVVRADRSPAGRVLDRVREVTSGKRRRTIATSAMILACVLLLPLPYRPTCDARLEPTTRRYVVAPFESSLEKTLVRPGDVVQRDEVVARLDGHELRLNLAEVEARLEQARSRYYAAQAASKPAETVQAQLEMKELTLQQEQLVSRKEKLQIKSPVHGVVLSGELERAEGASLTIGQSLLEVAPLDDLLVEIAVPEDRLRFIGPGSAVALKLDAFPGRKWRGTVERVRPVAEIRDAQNVFIAEIRLANEEGSLRPGMKGHAKVSGPVRPFVWILFHRPYEAVLQWLGW
jgi:multidrug resistance efflux pump